MSTGSSDATTSGRRNWAILLPLLLFGGLALVFLLQLVSGRDASVVPSALIGAPAPAAEVTPIAGLDTPLLDTSAFQGEVTIVNFWASWCAPCRAEHPLIVDLAGRGDVRVVGINYKDRPEQAKSFLDELGNPFSALGADVNGRVGIEWGVYGMPETFIIGRDGRIAYKHVGPLTPSAVEGRFGNALAAALQ